MSLIIDTLHSSKEIFLRVLILEPSDALDKISSECITDKERMQAHPNLFIEIISDKTTTITIRDFGIGMFVKNLGTVTQIWYQGFHGGHECWRRHLHHWTVRRWVLLGVFLFLGKFLVVSKNNDDK